MYYTDAKDVEMANVSKMKGHMPLEERKSKTATTRYGF